MFKITAATTAGAHMDNTGTLYAIRDEIKTHALNMSLIPSRILSRLCTGIQTLKWGKQV